MNKIRLDFQGNENSTILNLCHICLASARFSSTLRNLSADHLFPCLHKYLYLFKMNKFSEQINFNEFLAIVKNIFILSIKCYEKWVFGISKTRLKQHYKKKILLSNWNVSWVFILAVGPIIGCERILPIISIHFSTFLFFEVKYFFLF